MRYKIGILIESDFYEPEIEYYSHCFKDAGYEVHFLSRLWGNAELTFKGHEECKHFKCNESFENITYSDLKSYAAVSQDHRHSRWLAQPCKGMLPAALNGL